MVTRYEIDRAREHLAVWTAKQQRARTRLLTLEQELATLPVTAHSIRQGLAVRVGHARRKVRLADAVVERTTLVLAHIDPQSNKVPHES